MGPETLHATMPVLVTRAIDIPGIWVARCLAIDLVTQGPSLRAAFEMMREAVLMVVADDLLHGLDPLGRSPSEDSYWAEAMAIIRTGEPVANLDESRVHAATGVLVVRVLRAALPAIADTVALPPAWMIASLGELRNNQHA